MSPELDYQIAVIGLGYVGLPLAVAFSEKYRVIGYDINETRIGELQRFEDRTREITPEQLRAAKSLHFSSKETDLQSADIFIVTVPTPVDLHKKPDLAPLLNASRTIARYMKKGSIVVYESTVYPGCTEEDCVPVLEAESGLRYNVDFFCGYSPERINPGDKVHTFTKIKKVTSGSTPEIALLINRLYASVIEAGTHLAPSIKVAEASKAIENAQRDINISFINELALIFDRMDIDTTEVLQAAATKWNFLHYKPGLVGGHCIGVDPYYLAYKAEKLGYYPQVILSGRDVNDTMGVFVAGKLVKLLTKKGHALSTSKVLILGITFKENCADMRNTRVVDVYRELLDFGLQVDIHDPWASPDLAFSDYGIELLAEPAGPYNAILITVAHEQFLDMDIRSLTNENGVIYDLKAILPKELVDARL